jgi:outer membrane murein-binding lipoprotein Lpp
MTSSITKDTLIPISAVIIVISAGFSYGIMYQKVAGLEDQVAELNQSVTQLSKDVNRLIGAQSITYER